LRESIRLDPRFAPSYSNLAASLLALDRLAEARATLQEVVDRRLDFIGARRLSYFLAFVQGDSKTMARELESSVGVRETNSAFGWQARTSASDGRVKTAGSMLYPLAHLGLARAAALSNDLETARAAYDRILTLWNEADSNLQPLKDARLERSRLR
jgi:tetratricopeptide (TPR) repeat protein